MPIYRKQTTQQDNVLAAEVRAVLNDGKEWGTASSTLATVTDLDALAAGATLPQTVAKVNTILALLRNLNA
jgi:hypothetical protein